MSHLVDSHIVTHVGCQYAQCVRNFAGLVVRSALALCVGLSACDSGSNAEESFDEELSPGGELGKADGAGVAALPVDGDYAQTQVWEVTNQWEDTDTPAAREAGMAWPADSGLNWDEKYALWVESLETIDGYYNESFEITTPWGKTLEAAKLDCADVALTMRASFAASPSILPDVRSCCTAGCHPANSRVSQTIRKPFSLQDEACGTSFRKCSCIALHCVLWRTVPRSLLSIFVM